MDLNRFSLLEVDRDPVEVRCEAAARVSPAFQRALLDEVRDVVEDAVEGRLQVLVSAPLGALYRTSENVVGPGLVICGRHLRELAAYRFLGFDGRPRAIRVRAVGVRERVRGIVPVECGMCETRRAEGNVCYRDDCATPLHPEWPAVYCSDFCALEDR